MSDDQPLRVVIVDDEPLARTVIREFLRAHPGVEVAAECGNGFEAVKAVSELSPDLMFLDVQMPKLDGFEVLELLDTKPKVVFVTAYDEYAVRAFEVHAIDYLVKPFTAERFASVVARAEQAVRGTTSQAIGDLSAFRKKPLQRIAFKQGGSIEVLPVQRIDYIEAQDDYVHVFARGEKHIKQQTLTELEQVLDATRFVRVHRGYIVNLESLARVEPYAKDSRVVVLKDGSRIPVSRAGYERLKALL